MLSLLRIKDRIFYGWVVVTATFIIGLAMFGTRNSFGVFFKSLESEFDLNRAATSGIFSVYMVLGAAFAVLGGWALDRYGARTTILLMGLFTGSSLLLTSQASAVWQLFASYSLLLALGTGAGYTMLMAIVSRWFDKKRGLALGISGSGGGLGILVMTPFIAYLIADFGWRMAYIVTGVIAGLAIISLSLLLRNAPEEMGLLPDGAKSNARKIEAQGKDHDTQPTGFSTLQALRTRSFWFLWLTWLFQSTSIYLITTHIVPHTTDMGISTIKAAIVLSLIGGASIPGRLLAGSTSDAIGRKTAAVISSLLGAGALIWLIWAQDLWMFYLFAALFGFSWGGLSTMVTVLIGDVFGLRNIGVIMGWQGMAWFLGAAAGPAIGGVIFDATKSYSMAFVIGAIALLLTALFVALLTRQETK